MQSSLNGSPDLAAIDSLTAAIKENPSQAEPYLKRSKLYLKHNLIYYAHMDAIKFFEREPRSAEGLFHICLVLHSTKLYERNEKILETLISTQMPLTPERKNFVLMLIHESATEEYVKSQQEILDFAEKMKEFNIDIGNPMYVDRFPPISLENRRISLDWNLILEESSLEKRIFVNNCPGKGLGLFATRDYHKGDLIFMEKPLWAYSVDDRACHHCIKFSKLIPACPSCQIKCCSPECVESAKLYHFCSDTWTEVVERTRNCCTSTPKGVLGLSKLYGYSRNSHLPSAAAVVERYKALTLSEPMDEGSTFLYNNEGRANTFQDAIGKNQFFEVRWFREVDRRCSLNSFSIAVQDDPYPKLQGNGGAVFLVASLMNHSCEPNAGFSFNQEDLGATIIVKAKAPIKKGEEVTVSYLNEIGSWETRNSRLKGCYGFECECRRCKKDRCLNKS